MKRFIMILLAAALLILSGCSTAAEPETPPELRGFSEVFNDGVTVIEAGRLIRMPGSSEAYEYCFLEVKLTNNGTAPIYYSSMLCLSVSSNGSEFSNENTTDAVLAARSSIDGFATLDGVINPGSVSQGFVIFEAPVGTDSFSIRLATDFGKDEWAEFTCAVS